MGLYTTTQRSKTDLNPQEGSNTQNDPTHTINTPLGKLYLMKYQLINILKLTAMLSAFSRLIMACFIERNTESRRFSP
jgi:hypothetical protein